ncbi:MAG: outer membrane beta-barrel protein, partial [Marinilabiliaceae bacterium]|nr:outer membrane beta-barrel protein [Marinilabiliaceae bacterium]
MKLLTLIMCGILCTGFSAYSQESPVDRPMGKIGIFYTSFGDNELVRSEGLEGAPGYSGDKFYTLGVNYLYPFTKWLDFQTGLVYSKHQVTITPNVVYDYIPGVDYPPVKSYNEDLSVISIPVGVQINFLKYLFVNGGFSLDFDAGSSNSFDDQTGIGLQVGAGVQYEFKNKISLFINPYSKSHSIVSFSSQDNRQRLLEAGVKMGVMLR